MVLLADAGFSVGGSELHRLEALQESRFYPESVPTAFWADAEPFEKSSQRGDLDGFLGSGTRYYGKFNSRGRSKTSGRVQISRGREGETGVDTTVSRFSGGAKAGGEI